jgi:hypothetical protein
MNSVSESIGQSIVFFENAVDVWNDLKERFSQGDLVRISELMQEIYSLHQDSKSVTEFYSDLKVLWEELEVYMPIPQCTCCYQCSCEAMRAARKNHSNLYAIRFLTGLNDNFSMVKSQILLIDPLPPMNKIFSMVLQHERQGNFGVVDESKVLVNAVDSKKSILREVFELILNLLVVKIIGIAPIVTSQVTLLKVASKSMAILHICNDLIVLIMPQLKGVNLLMMLVKLIPHQSHLQSLRINLIS